LYFAPLISHISRIAVFQDPRLFCHYSQLNTSEDLKKITN